MSVGDEEECMNKGESGGVDPAECDDGFIALGAGERERYGWGAWLSRLGAERTVTSLNDPPERMSGGHFSFGTSKPPLR